MVRRERKHRPLVIRRNVRAYRKWQARAGIRRVDVALSAIQSAAVVALMRPGETYGAALERLLEGISGNRQPAKRMAKYQDVSH